MVGTRKLKYWIESTLIAETDQIATNPPIRCKKLYLNSLAEGSDRKIGKTISGLYPSSQLFSNSAPLRNSLPLKISVAFNRAMPVYALSSRPYLKLWTLVSIWLSFCFHCISMLYQSVAHIPRFCKRNLSKDVRLYP